MLESEAKVISNPNSIPVTGHQQVAQKPVLPPALQEIYQRAARQHGAGQLADAERGYRQVLAVQPDHADSLHLLGVIGYQAGQHEAAAALLRKAIAIHAWDPAYHCNLGLILQSLGRVAEAEAAYRQALHLNPDHAEAHTNLGNVLLAMGRSEEAVGHYGQTLAVRPNDALTHNNLGLALYGLTRLDEAEASYRRALAIAPQMPDAHKNLAATLQHVGRLDEAASHYGQALVARPNDAQAQNNLANVLQAMGRLEDAVARYRQALALRPEYPEAHNNLGNVLQRLGRLEEAVACYTRALTLAPQYVEAHSNLGNALQTLGQLDEAERCYRRALALRPEYAEAHNNLGQVLEAAGWLNEAMACYSQALALRPEYADAQSNLGNALLALGRLDEAMERYEQALALQPQSAEAQLGIGNVLQAQGRLLEADACYAQLLELRPGYAKGHLNRAFAQLRRGDLTAGWLSHEWRWRLEDRKAPKLTFVEPQWRGEPLQGARILLPCEQGLGDSLQFLRYLPLVRAAGGTIVLQVPASLQRMARRLPEVAELVVFGEPLPDFDWHCPLLSLPLACGTTLENIPATVPYLTVAPEAKKRAAAYPWPSAGLRIGLAWAGNPKHGNDRFRSIALPWLEPLLRLEGVNFFSLQLGEASAQLAALHAGRARVTDLAPAIADLEDTAALIGQLDLVITVDTAVAHLTGALGRPLWLLLAKNSDWRWLMEREDSPWYPTARLFRQSELGDWSGVIERVAAALVSLAGGSGAVS